MRRINPYRKEFMPKRARSTRAKIKDEAQRLVYDIEKMQERLQKIDELANGGSKVITESLPPLVVMLDGVKPFLERFHEEL
jgi:hypothetical protein